METIKELYISVGQVSAKRDGLRIKRGEQRGG